MPLDKNLSPEQIVKELGFLKASLPAYTGNYYKQAILRIKYLRNKQIQIRKKSNAGIDRDSQIE
jgi:hypothetical protein